MSDDKRTPADIYDELFVPALFRQWAPVVLDAAGVKPGDAVLDVACGTGVLALAAAERVGPGGSIAALDATPEMLAVARRKSDRVDWCHGMAEALPFANDSFDAVVSQFGMMFFSDRPAAMREMFRVLRSGGRLAVAVCDSLGHSPGYAAFATLLKRLFGDSVAEAFSAPFVLGDPQLLLSICGEAGIAGARVQAHAGVIRFASIASLVSTERACAWTLGGLLDQQQFKQLLQESERSLQGFTKADGTIAFAMPALIVTARKP
ncbi:class I SAM-dependent methyltransferase [Phyllobacterium lublinensis]|uniref:class I SAM-dependent methyltransferase n=1 Tax=Phyllobacterium lublinensis TaxID=2875708 RepID=UPI001CCC50B9|nr:class I SAM-dependent methyltransferase [Phyllobacterium sp. 2063]MBZ9656691.1 class I SAM-dependent methyltransferase [Phyllobacterium sp. 2063]